MNYDETVEKVMTFLKERKVCSSSRKSHRECYDSLKFFMLQEKKVYSSDVRESWFAYLQATVPKQRYDIWIKYAYQLEEMEITGTISDRTLYLNRSLYKKLPEQWKKELDYYLESCGQNYTNCTFESMRRNCSEALLIMDEMGISTIQEIDYKIIIRLINSKMYCTDKTKQQILNNVASMIRFYGDIGVCPHNYSLVFNCKIYPHIGLISQFMMENQTFIAEITDPEMTANEFYHSIPCFIQILEKHGYIGTTLKLAKHALTALYLFLDIHALGYHPRIMWIWFDEIRKTMGSSWLHWRRILKFYESFAVSGDIDGNGKYMYKASGFEELPSWCQEAITGLLEQKRREFREAGTIRTYRYSCISFCCFLISKGFKNFESLSPAIIKEYAVRDKHKTFKGRATRFVIVRAFLRYLDEYGYTKMHHLDECLISGTAPEERIIDILSDEQMEKIERYRSGHHSPVELRDIATVLLGLRMGFRSYDILSLRFQDIDWNKRQISIVMKKTKTQINLPMPVEVGNALYMYIMSGRPQVDTEYIFLKSKAPYGKLSGKVCTNALYRILPERRSVKGGGFHVTRRTFATNLLRNHAGIDAVMDALGHRDPTSVMKYLLLDEERIQQCGLSLESAGILMKEAWHEV